MHLLGRTGLQMYRLTMCVELRLDGPLIFFAVWSMGRTFCFERHIETEYAHRLNWYIAQPFCDT